MPELIVVGAGIAGLVAARSAALAGRERVTIVAPAGGGQVARARVRPVGATGALGAPSQAESAAGWVEVGAEGFATRGGVMAEYLDRLGLADSIIDPAPHPTRVRWSGGATPIPLASVLGIPADLDDPLLTEAIGPEAVRDARALDSAPLPTGWCGEAGAPHTLGELVRERMGASVADRLVAPLVAGVLGRDAYRTPAEELIPGLLARLRKTGSLAGAIRRIRVERAGRAGGPGEAAGGSGRGELASLAGGMSVLAMRLRAECHLLGIRRVVATVTGVDRRLDGLRVQLAGGASLAAGRVILATHVPGLAPAPSVRHRQVLVLAGRVTGPADRGGIIVPDPMVAGVGRARAGDPLDPAVSSRSSEPASSSGSAPPGADDSASSGGAGPTRLAAVTFTSAKWGEHDSQGDRGERRHGAAELLRLTYTGARPRTPADGRADLRELGYDVHTLASARRAWRLPRPRTLPELPPGVQATGAHVLGPGLARIVAHAEALGRGC